MPQSDIDILVADAKDGTLDTTLPAQDEVTSEV
jgi:predicted nucleotidyltransferase